MGSHRQRPGIHKLCTHSEGFTFSRSLNSALLRPSTHQQTREACDNRHLKSRPPNAEYARKTTFPATLTLPGDALDTVYFNVEAEEPQSFTAWLHEEDRNPVTPQRQSIYIGSPPKISKDVGFLDEWKVPQNGSTKHVNVACPQVEDVMQYIAAFYWPLPVKQLDRCEFVNWEDEPSRRMHKGKTGNNRRDRQSNAPRLGLYDPARYGITRIRSRCGLPAQPYAHQLSVSDLIDAMIESIPKDAYAAILLLEHDMYEDEDDEFIVGRAYGGSRVAVVSLARYNPILDALQDVPTQHAWPLSHCVEFIRSCGAKVDKPQIVKLEDQDTISNKPILNAIAHSIAHDNSKINRHDESNKLWLHRVCRTVGHELGHCFGLDHCLYYECVMQTTANIAEDTRQPAYLCPVDLAKLLEATGSEATELERCSSLALVCKSLGPGGGFGALEAWMIARVHELQELMTC